MAFKVGDKVRRWRSPSDHMPLGTEAIVSFVGTVSIMLEGYGNRWFDMQYFELVETTPHVHAKEIIAWANGAQIQIWNVDGWIDIGVHGQVIYWAKNSKFRVKPTPKPDCVETRGLAYNTETGILSYVPTPNVKYTFDGETGNLKSVEKI